MDRALSVSKENKRIFISTAVDFSAAFLIFEAQCYATGYYEREGFSVCSDEFLEDGIPHVQMILEL